LERGRQTGGVQQSPLPMCQHGPEPLQHSRRHTRPEQRNVSLQICSNKVVPPAQTDRVIWCEVAAGKPTPSPKLEERRLFGGAAPGR
jgi:hypothetical protein